MSRSRNRPPRNDLIARFRRRIPWWFRFGRWVSPYDRVSRNCFICGILMGGCSVAFLSSALVILTTGFGSPSVDVTAAISFTGSLVLFFLLWANMAERARLNEEFLDQARKILPRR